MEAKVDLLGLYFTNTDTPPINNRRLVIVVGNNRLQSAVVVKLYQAGREADMALREDVKNCQSFITDQTLGAQTIQYRGINDRVPVISE